MHTSMPYGRSVEITPEHVQKLRMAGPDGLLVWQESLGKAAVWTPTAHVDAYTMIIASGRILDIIRRDHPEGVELTDAQIAEDLSILGHDATAEWPRVQALTHQLIPIRRRVWESEGICLERAPEYRLSTDGTHHITDTYAYPDGDLRARVTVAFAYEKPTRIDLSWPREDPCQGTGITLDVAWSTPTRTKAELIAQTVITTLRPGH